MRRENIMSRNIARQDEKERSQKNILYKRWCLALIAITTIAGFEINSIDVFASNSSSSSKQSISKSSSIKKAKRKAVLKTRQYNDTDALTNAQNFDDDAYRNKTNIGKSIHLTNAKIGNIGHDTIGIWIQTTTDDSNINNAFIQAINMPSYHLKEGDVVDIKGTLQGMQKSMVTFKGDTDKYPTIWITSITKTQ